jgi:hypothetical protein
MATPHVAGAIALLWSAQPGLRHDVAMTETILNESAVHLSSALCSSAGLPNNTFGFGRLDVKAAIDGALMKITDVADDGTDVTINFFGVAGATYRLERKLDLTDAGWQSIQAVPDLHVNTTGPAHFTDLGADALGKAFYHVTVVP